MPMPTPRGVAKAKMNIIYRQRRKSSGKVLTREMPRDTPAAILWITMASTMFTHSFISKASPTASPSKTEWTERAIMRMKGVMSGQHLSFFFYSCGKLIAFPLSLVGDTFSIETFLTSCCSYSLTSYPDAFFCSIDAFMRVANLSCGFK